MHVYGVPACVHVCSHVYGVMRVHGCLYTCIYRPKVMLGVLCILYINAVFYLKPELTHLVNFASQLAGGIQSLPL